MVFEGYIFPEVKIEGNESKDKEKLLDYISKIQQTVEKWVESIISGSKYRVLMRNDIFWNIDYKEVKELNEKLDKIYENSIKNFELVLEEQFKWLKKEKLASKKVLIQVPSTHSIGFITKLIEHINDKRSIFSQVQVEYFVIDSESLINFKNNPEKINEIYGEYIEKVKNADKFIEIKDTTIPYKSLVWDDWKTIQIVGENEKKFLNVTKELKTPRLKTYFPTYQQAKESGLSIQKFIKLWEKATRLNVREIREANEEIIEFLKDIEKIKIIWDNIDILINVRDKYWRNSWWDTNQPWAEVFTSPYKYGVDGVIIFEEKNVIKMLGPEENRVIERLKLEFEKWRLKSIDIDKKEKNLQEEELLKKLQRIIFNWNEANLYTGEFAFGTTPEIKAWTILHPLLAEKAFGIHIALWNSYKYKWMFNWNKWADYHWDIIGSMKKTKIIWITKQWKEKVIMEEGEFNKEYFSKIVAYKNKIEKK